MPNVYLSLVLVVLFSPLLGFALIGLLAWTKDKPSETVIVRISRTSLVISFLAALVLGVPVLFSGKAQVHHWATWFQSGEHQFALSFLIDRLSVAMILLTTLLCSLIGHFSITYLHADRGFLRFFLLLQAFAVGMLLLVMASGVELLFVGWELVGLTSALLIMYFHERSGPVRNGIRTFVVYRLCDVGLLMGMVFLHHYAHSTAFHSKLTPGHWMSGMAYLSPTQATFVALLFLLAAMGKSAQLPVGGWLPRAMEGPTPSSAIFYGGLSVHAGVYLLLRAQPLLEQSPSASIALIVVGLTTAIFATLMGRIQTDIKNTLAYATMTQVGLMFVEIGLHFYTIAAIHLVGHACLRTWQLLRSPSVLHELHQLRGALDHEFETGRWLENIERRLPGNIGRALYQHAIHRFYFESILERLVLHPILWLAHKLAWFEQNLFHSPKTKTPPASQPASSAPTPSASAPTPPDATPPRSAPQHPGRSLARSLQEK